MDDVSIPLIGVRRQTSHKTTRRPEVPSGSDHVPNRPSSLCPPSLHGHSSRIFHRRCLCLTFTFKLYDAAGGDRVLLLLTNFGMIVCR